MRPAACLYVLIGIAVASWVDVDEMRKPVPFIRFPKHVFARPQLRLVVAMIYATLWLPIFGGAALLFVRRHWRKTFTPLNLKEGAVNSMQTDHLGLKPFPAPSNGRLSSLFNLLKRLFS